MPKKPVKVYLTTRQRHLLAAIAKREEVSCSEVLRHAFMKYAYIDGTPHEQQRIRAWMNEQ